MKKIFDFGVVCVYILALVGGTAYLLVGHNYLFAVANVLLAAMAFPYAKEKVYDLMDNDEGIVGHRPRN